MVRMRIRIEGYAMAQTVVQRVFHALPWVGVWAGVLLLGAGTSSCGSKAESGYAGSGSGSQPGGSGSGSSIPPTTGQGLNLNDAGSVGENSDAAAFDYDASLAPPMEVPTKVAGMQYKDFASTPVLDTAGTSPAPANSQQLFGAATQGAQTGGPCLMEPEPRGLLPRNRG